VENREFELGEAKYIDWLVKPTRKNDTVVITSARWELIDDKTGQVRGSGPGIINGNMVSVLLAPEAKGKHILRTIIEVPPETLIEEARIDVY
jgi:hypothetical protein